MKIISVLFVLLLGVGCSSPVTQIHYYQLVPLDKVIADNTVQQPLALAPVSVAGYLNGSGLVLQQSAVELSIARQHLWADALQQQLQRQLTEYLLLAKPSQPLVSMNTPGSRSLALEIDRFYANSDGQAILSGRYSLSGLQGTTTVPFFKQQTLTADGYPAMVEALSLAWQQLLHDITSTIKDQSM